MKRRLSIAGLAVVSAFGVHITPVSAITCSSFSSQEEAQAYYRSTGASNLDRDRDGIACESLPRRGSSTPPAPAPSPDPAPFTPPVTTPPTSPVVPLLNVVVVSVGDGDTIRVRQGDPCGNGGAARRFTVRLGCIDAMETNQPGGQQSAARLRQLLPQGQAIQLRKISVDRYGRTVGEVYRGGKSINLQLVREGRAVVYRQFLNGCRATQGQFLQAEQQARAARRGFWGQARPVFPWLWRQGRR